MNEAHPSAELVPGVRVVLRHRLPAGSSHPMTDVLGVLESLDPVVVRAADGRLVTVARADVVALKAVPPRPVSTRAVHQLEHAAALAWPGLEQEWLDGWLLRAGAGFTGRANCCVPLGPEPDDGVARVRAWFTERALTPRFLLPDRLSVDLPGWRSHDRVTVLTAPTAAVAGDETDVRDDCDERWLAGYHYRGGGLPDAAPAVLRAVLDGELGFGRVEQGGEVVAIARGAVTAAPDGTRWLGITAVEVAPPARRRGLGRQICAGLAAWGAERGAGHAYLQVATDNDAARRMYTAMGFTEHHRYSYALPA